MTKSTSRPSLVCTFESDVFGGYSVVIDTTIAQTLDEVLIFAVSSLQSVFDSNCLVKLLDLSRLRNFKIKKVDDVSNYNRTIDPRMVRSIIITDSLSPLI